MRPAQLLAFSLFRFTGLSVPALTLASGIQPVHLSLTFGFGRCSLFSCSGALVYVLIIMYYCVHVKCFDRQFLAILECSKKSLTKRENTLVTMYEIVYNQFKFENEHRTGDHEVW